MGNLSDDEVLDLEEDDWEYYKVEQEFMMESQRRDEGEIYG
jgi:hypothetical protein